MRDTPRYAALELAVAFCNTREENTPKDVVNAASAFHDFLTTNVTSDEAPAKPAKATPAKAADKAPPAAEAKAEAPAETPAPKTETKAETKAAAKAEPEASAADTSKMVVKLVTKIGRDQAIAWMQKTFNSPNVSGLDTTKHSYASVIKKITAHIAELEAAAESSPAE